MIYIGLLSVLQRWESVWPLFLGLRVNPTSGAWNPARGACSTDGNFIGNNADEDSFMHKLISKADVYVRLYASK